MAKIKIKDLPKDLKVSEDQLKKIRGGALLGQRLRASGAGLFASGGGLLASGGSLFASGGRVLASG